MIALVTNSSQAVALVTCPRPNPCPRYSSMPPSEGYFAPSLPNEYPCRPAITPASRKDSHTADPATSPAAPSRAKIPAPTIAPTPMNEACTRVIRRSGTWSGAAGVLGVVDMRTASFGGAALATPSGQVRAHLRVPGHPTGMTSAPGCRSECRSPIGVRSEGRRDPGQGDPLPDDVRVGLPLGQLDPALRHRLVGHLPEEVGDDVQPGPLLVVRVRDEPGRPGAVARADHVVPGAGVVAP